MKLKYALLLIILGIVALVVGALFKIQHWAGADVLIISAGALMASGLALIVVWLFRNPKTKDLLNS